MRDDFTQATKETLAKRVGCRCSNPDCRKLTSGPHEEDTKSVNIGIAAHITAAASGVGAKRYDPNLSTEERKSITNGIWLCQNCGKLVDSDEQKYSVELLICWKRDAEDRAASEVESIHQSVGDGSSLIFRNYLNSLVGEPQKWWLDEINDLTWFEFPLSSITKEKPKKPDDDPKNTPPQLVIDAIKDCAQEKILIVGPPGAGKSTLLEMICKQAAALAIEDPQAPIPVFVELRDYKTGEGFRGFILQNLESHDPSLDDGDLTKLLEKRRLLLLVDGLNEKPEARRDLTKFCRNIQLIATGRQDGDGWDIERKLELQPLSEKQVRDFFELRLPDADRKQLQTLGDRVRDFGQTPLMVWMLYSIFRANKDVPETRGEAYRSFTTLYGERAKDGIDLSDSRSLLGKLAFEMMRSSNDDPIDFRLKISEVEAQRILGSEATFKRMLNHLLKQQGKPGNCEISFCHQSLQEYYAAEWLWERVGGLDNTTLQQEFLNYLKWTEPVALMLALVESEALAVRVVTQALGVDLMLGARLAGEVKREFQDQTFKLVDIPKVPNALKIQLLANTQSHFAVPSLLKIMEEPNPESDIRELASELLVSIGSESTISGLLKLIENPNDSVRESAAATLGELNSGNLTLILLSLLENTSDIVRKSAVIALKESRIENIIPELFKLLENPSERCRESAVIILDGMRSASTMPGLIKGIQDPSSLVRESVAEALGNRRDDMTIPYLLQLVEDVDDNVRKSVASALGKIRSEKTLPGLAKLAEDDSSCVRKSAASALCAVQSEEKIPILLKLLEDTEDDVRQNVISAMCTTPSERIIPVLIQITESPNFKNLNFCTRWDIVNTLDKIESKEIIPTLITLLEDSNINICQRAIDALIKIGFDSHIPDLLKLIEHPDSDIRDAAVDVLVDSDSEMVITGLLKLVENSNIRVRESAIEALISAESEAKILRLFPIIKNACSDVRESVISALLEIDSEVIVSGFENIVEENPEVCQSIKKIAENSLFATEDSTTISMEFAESADSRDRAIIKLVGSESAVPNLISLMDSFGAGGTNNYDTLSNGHEAFKICSLIAAALADVGSDSAILALLTFAEHPQSCIRSSAFRALINMSCECKMITSELIKMLNHSDNNVREGSVEALGIICSETAIPALIKLLEESNSDLRWIAAEALDNIADKHSNTIAAYFSHLSALITTDSGADVYRVLNSIQSNCKFYNYEIQQAKLRKADRTSLGDGGVDPFAKIEDKLESIDRRTKQQMAEQPSTISISGGTFNGPVNLASNQGHQPTTIIDTQNNYFGTDEALQKQITDLQTFITELEAQHPNIQTEEQANQLVQQQLDQIQTQSPDRWQKLRHQMGILKAQFFNPERHVQAFKATVVEVTKAKWEESLIVKAIVTYLDKFSETPDKGA